MKKITLSQIGLYNPQRLSDEVVESLFVIRKKIFDLIIKKIQGESANSIPQHYLFIGQRGMGKTTMLKRLEVELRKDNYKEKFIPLLFPEEQYNLKNLAEFWLNCLDALADTLEVEKDSEIVKSIDSKVKELQKIKENDDLTHQTYNFFKSVCKSINRRPVLLVDNMSFIFDRFDKANQHELRGLLMQNGAPILVGASAVALDNTYDYGAPFYDAFQIYYLKKLDFNELLNILSNLAKLTESESVTQDIQKENGRLKTLHLLTGGNPRTSVMLFKLIIKGFSPEINDDLEALLDEITPLYKARFEELSTQMQVIVDAIALHWDPIVLEDLRTETRYENSQLSPQLKRLEELGWIERLEAYKAKGKAYQISERFFNIWFLMRRSSRRQKRELYCLSKFLETFYGDELENIAHKRLTIPCKTIDHATYNLAMAEVVKDENLKNLLQNKGYGTIREQAKNNSEILTNFNIPKNVNNALELEENLSQNLKQNPENEFIWFQLASLYHLELKEFEKATGAYLKVISINPNISLAWNRLGCIYQDYFKNYMEAEKAYLKAFDLDKTEIAIVENLASLYHYNLNRYEEAELFYLKIIKLNYNHKFAWHLLAHLYQTKLYDFPKAVKAYHEAIRINSKFPFIWYNIGMIYKYNLYDIEKAKESILNGLKLFETDKNLWHSLALLHHDYSNQYQEAEKAYLKAIEYGDEFVAKHNLVFLYRDKLNQYDKAKELFETLKPESDLEDSYWLNQVIFDLHDKNLGIAKENLQKAFTKIDGQFPENTQDDWWRFGAVVHKLGYTSWFTDILKEQGFDITLAPYFIALKAMMDKNSEAYIDSKAVEFREPSRKLMEIMQNYISK